MCGGADFQDEQLNCAFIGQIIQLLILQRGISPCLSQICSCIYDSATFPCEGQHQSRQHISRIKEYNPVALLEASSPINNPMFVQCQRESHETQHSFCDIPSC